MRKNILKLNSAFAAVILSVVVLVGSGTPAQAGILDWFSGKENKPAANQSFGFISSYLDIESLGKKSTGSSNAFIIQGSSLVSVNSPSVLNPATPTNKLTIAREMIVPASAYSSTPDQTDDSPFITAWNTHVRDGIVAANFLPFGTKIMIPEIYGEKVFVVEDRMNRRYWHKIDIWFPDRSSALEFGVKTLKIQILES